MRAYAITDIGMKRVMNQDYVHLSLERVGALENLFIVADGMGGHRGGGYASRMAVETIVEAASQTGAGEDGTRRGAAGDTAEWTAEDTMEWTPEAVAAGNAAERTARTLVDAIREANRRIWRISLEDERYAGMGTTVVAASVIEEELVVANVGDSRLYVANDEEIRQITQDHSYVEELVRNGGISREQARRHRDRNIILRAVGVERDLKVDCFFVPVKPGDKVLLCSDGLTNMLEDGEICGILNENAALEERARHLVEAANERGGWDNISVVIVEPFEDEVDV